MRGGTSMQFLGALRGGGVLSSGHGPIGRVDYDIDGFLTRPGEIIASGELRMSAGVLDAAFGRADLTLATDDGRALTVRFSGKREQAGPDGAHADISGDLPSKAEWQRRGR